MTTVVNAVGNFSTDALSTTLVTTIPSVTAGNALIATGLFFGTGASTFSSNGTGTWTQIFDDGALRHRSWICLNPSAGTTTVTATSAVAGFFTVHVMEVNGLQAAGSSTAVGAVNTTPTATAWASSAINPAYLNFAVGVSSQVDNSTATSTAGAGFSITTGTGMTSGTVRNTSEGDTLVVVYGDFAAGSVTATGTWSTAVTGISWITSYQRASGGGGGGGGQQNRLLLGVG